MKSRIAEDYNATAGIYDMRYREEQGLKIGFLLNRVRLKDGDTVIDAGCGTGLLLEAVSGRAKTWLVGLDSSIGMLQEARRKGVEADLVLGDIESMPFRDCVADAVFSVSVIQLADDPGRAVSEIRRITKAGGTIAISYLKSAGIECPQAAGIRAAVHASETMKDIFITGFRED
ncbi:MAG: methyltransferase domain-containing protein [Candidatus Methanosuratincola petrocarbonis]